MSAEPASGAGASLRFQVLALVTASLFVSLGLAIAILIAMPPPRPAPISLREVASALRGGPLSTASGRRLQRAAEPRFSLAQAPSPPPMMAQRAALASMLNAPLSRVILDFQRPPTLAGVLTRGIDLRGPPPPWAPSGPRGPPPGPPPGPPFAGAPGEDYLFGDFVAALASPSGDLVVVRSAPEPWPTPWQLAIIGWLAGSAVLLTPPAFWLARRISAPLDDFARAAEQLGRNPNAPPLAPSGPGELRRAIRAFNEMQVRVRRYLEDRTSMVGAISHDLRTPLARIRFKLEAQAVDRLAIAADLDQMERMIGHVLTFLRDGQEPQERARINFLSLVETVVDEAVEGGACVRLVREDDGIVEGDVSALQRVLGNLIINAVKYGERADVSVFAAPGEIRVEVEDDGPGLAPAERAAVFRPFYRTEAARTLDVGGVGLGLALSRSIARAHGGDVDLEMRSRGLIAVLTLPTA